MSTIATLLSPDTLSTLVAASATVSLAYSYRYSIVRQGLYGYSYLKQQFRTDPFVAPVLNDEAPSAAASCTQTRLFPHVERIDLVYADCDETTRLTDAQEESLRRAITQWRAVPLDGISQHLSLYEVLRNAFRVYWETVAVFPTAIHVVCDTMLMELTDTPCLVSMSDNDGTRVVLTQGTTNHLVWPLSSAFTPGTADAPEDPDK